MAELPPGGDGGSGGGGGGNPNMRELFAESSSSDSSDSDADLPRPEEEEGQEGRPEEREKEDMPPPAAEGEKEGAGSNMEDAATTEGSTEGGGGGSGGGGGNEQDGGAATSEGGGGAVGEVGSVGDAEDEEEDAEFGGDDGIVGTSAPARPEGSDDDDDRDRGVGVGDRMEGDDRNDGGEGGGGPERKKQRRPPRPPRRMEVLDIPRPRGTAPDGGPPGEAANNGVGTVTMHMAKMPNVVGINPEAFDPNTYDAADEEREYRGYVHNMIRWRYKLDPNTGKPSRDENGKLVRESNARFVRWSDGSLTLHVGNEAFEVDELSSKPTGPGCPVPGFAGADGYLYLQQKAKLETSEGVSKPGGTVLECMGTIQSKMLPRPVSLQSDAHKNLMLAVKQKSAKTARIAEHVTTLDPEKEKEARIRNKEDLNKQAMRGNRRAPQRRQPAMSRRYLESEDDGNYDGVSIGRLKRGVDVMDYGDDNSDSEDEWSKQKKYQRGSRRPPAASRRRFGSDRRDAGRDSDGGSSDDSDRGTGGGGGGSGRGGDDEVMFGEDSSDDEDTRIKARAGSKKKSHQAVFDEDEDSE